MNVYWMQRPREITRATNSSSGALALVLQIERYERWWQWWWQVLARFNFKCREKVTQAEDTALLLFAKNPFGILKCHLLSINLLLGLEPPTLRQ